MSTNKTTNLIMNSWAPTDNVKRVEFNENFDILDNKYKEIDDTIALIQQDVNKNTNDISTNNDSLVSQLGEKANSTDVNNSLTLKADKTTTNNLQTQVSALSNGAPLPVSLVSQMTDHTKNYVYTGSEVGYTSGHWYYWNGTVWADGGVYQSTALPTNTGDQLVNNNLFNSATVISGSYIGSGGAVTAASGFYYSDYIPIDPTKALAFYGAFSIVYQLVCYDTNKNYLGFIATSDCSGSLGAYTITNISHISSLVNTAFVRANTTQPNDYMMVYATSYPASYAPFGKYVISNDLLSGMKNNLALTLDNAKYNTSLGTNNLLNPNGSQYATAMGYQALKNLSSDGTQDSGYYNTAMGAYAGKNVTTGNHLTLVGFQAGMGLTTGTGDTAVGEDALASETTGVGNVAIGQRAIQQSTGAQNNTAVGTSSMYWNSGSNVTGSDNTAIGHYSGENVGSDTQCTFLGYFASKDVDENSYTNSTAVGANAKISKSNQVVLGNPSVTEVDFNGDLQSSQAGKGITLLSPNGTKYKLTISDVGALTVTAV